MNNVIIISEDSLQVTLYLNQGLMKLFLLSLQMDDSLVLLSIFYFVCLIRYAGSML